MNPKPIKSTSNLDKILSQVESPKDLKTYIKENSIPEFDSVSDYLCYMVNLKGLDKSQVISQSNIQRNYGYQI